MMKRLFWLGKVARNSATLQLTLRLSPQSSEIFGLARRGFFAGRGSLSEI